MGFHKHSDLSEDEIKDAEQSVRVPSDSSSTAPYSSNSSDRTSFTPVNPSTWPRLFLKENDIAQEVITGATVQQGNLQGMDGYFITTHPSSPSQNIEALKMDSQRWATDQQQSDRRVAGQTSPEASRIIDETRHESSQTQSIWSTIKDKDLNDHGALKAISLLITGQIQYRRAANVNLKILCQLPEFVSQELSDDQSVSKILTLSGTSQNAFAASCHDYLERYWPGQGPVTLHWLMHSVKPRERGKGKVKHDRFDLNANLHLVELLAKNESARDFWKHPPELDYRITDSGDCEMSIPLVAEREEIFAFVQILTWLTCIFRIPTESLAYSKPIVSCERRGSEFFLEIASKELEPVPLSDSCWCSMIPRALIAWKFPVPDRGSSGMRGLEIDGDAMALLSRIRYPLHNIDGSILCLKGRATLLIPVWARDNCVQWHFVHSLNNIGVEQLEFYLNKTDPIGQLRLDAMKDARHFVGYCENAAIFAATRDSGYETAEPSGAHEEPTQIRWCNDYVVGGQFSVLGWGGPSFAGKIQLTRSLQAPVVEEFRLLEDEVLDSQTQPTVVFNTGKKTGFVLPELSVLVTLLHMWAKNRPDTDDIMPRLPFASPDEWDASILAREIWARKNARILEECTSENGEVTIMSRLKHFYLSLQQRRDAVAIDRLRTSSFPSIKRNGKKGELKGWDMLNIVKPRGPSNRRAISVDVRKTGRWCEMLDSRPDMTVLFVHGLKDLIRPSSPTICAAWSPIPQSTYTLAMTVHMALEMSKEHSTGSERLQVSRDFCIVGTEGREVFEGCKVDGSSTCQRVHAVSKEPKGPIMDLRPSDCLLLGNPSAWKNLPCCQSTDQGTSSRPSGSLLEDPPVPTLPSLHFDALTMNESGPSDVIVAASQGMRS